MSCNKARSIHIFLLDGDPDGVRMAQIAMSTIQAIAFPRSLFSRVKSEFKEIKRPGVYLLLGSDPNDNDQRVAYVGESEDVAERLQFHSGNEKGKDKKEFWTDTIALISKDENLTKSHARHIEAKLISAANSNPRWKLTNAKKPPVAGKLPKPDEAAMGEFIDQAKTLTGALGWDLFKATTGKLAPTEANQGNNSNLPDSPEFYFSGTGFNATAIVNGTNGDWIVREKSTARLDMAKAMPNGAKKLREQLKETGKLIEVNGALRFQEDCLFTSPSTAACVVSGNSTNGRLAWKRNDGMTYSDWEIEQSKSISDGIEGEGDGDSEQD